MICARACQGWYPTPDMMTGWGLAAIFTPMLRLCDEEALTAAKLIRLYVDRCHDVGVGGIDQHVLMLLCSP